MTITLCGSLSKLASPLGASMHNAGYRALGLPYTYVPFEIDRIDAALTAMRCLKIRGLGISVPFKLAVMPLLDSVEPLAQRIGAVNTVVNDGGQLKGFNTDHVGALRALQEVSPVNGKRVLLLGAGGAARAVGHGLAAAGAVVLFSNRTDSKAEQLVCDTPGTAWRPWGGRNELHDVDIVVNTTTVGMTGAAPGPPIDASALSARHLVMDIVYKPLETALVTAARNYGAEVIRGDRMLLHQAARQFELYTGRDAPLDAMDAALSQHQ